MRSPRLRCCRWLRCNKHFWQRSRIDRSKFPKCNAGELLPCGKMLKPPQLLEWDRCQCDFWVYLACLGLGSMHLRDVQMPWCLRTGRHQFKPIQVGALFANGSRSDSLPGREKERNAAKLSSALPKHLLTQIHSMSGMFKWCRKGSFECSAERIIVLVWNKLLSLLQVLSRIGTFHKIPVWKGSAGTAIHNRSWLTAKSRLSTRCPMRAILHLGSFRPVSFAFFGEAALSTRSMVHWNHWAPTSYTAESLLVLRASRLALQNIHKKRLHRLIVYHS